LTPTKERYRPVVSAFVVEKMGWQWMQWVPLIAIVLSFFAAIGMAETHPDVIHRRREELARPLAAEDGIQTPSTTRLTRVFAASKAIPSSLSTYATDVVARPLSSLVARPSEGLLSAYVALVFAAVFAICLVTPEVFASQYNFDTSDQALSFFGMCAGSIIAIGLFFLHERLLYKRRFAAWKTQNDYVEANNREIRKSSLPTNGEKNMTSGIRQSKRQSYQTRASIAKKEELKVAVVELLAISAGRVNTAVAVSRYLDELPTGRRIPHERILGILNNTLEFSKICNLLETYGVILDRPTLAKVIVDSMSEGTEDGDTELPPVLRRASLHREAAQAALLYEDTPPPPVPPMPAAYAEENLARLKHDDKPVRPLDPPSKWRIIPALPASLALPVGIFLYGWSAEASLHWIVPVIGMALIAMSGMLIYLSATLYTLQSGDRQTTTDVMSARTTLTFALSFGFAMFALPMYDALGVGRASSVLGCLAVALGMVPWVIVMRKAE